ncbi:hypothetical protein ACOSP7_021797 [Xanthoceras sorbifolium]
MTSCVTSQEAWSVLERLYSQKSMAKVLQLKQQLQAMKKGGCFVSDFALKIKAVDNDLVLSILNGIGHEYDLVVVFISSQRLTMSLQEVQYMLMIHEQKIAYLNSSSQVDVSNINTNFVAGNQCSRQPQRGGSSNGREGGKDRGRGRNGGKLNNNKNRSSYQICGREGHSAMYYYNRFDRSYLRNKHKQLTIKDKMALSFKQMPISPLHILLHQKVFVIQFGKLIATNHGTTGLSNLSISSEHKGNDRLAYGNGQQLHISHVANIAVHSLNSYNSLILKNVLCVPSIAKNLLSIS